MATFRLKKPRILPALIVMVVVSGSICGQICRGKTAAEEKSSQSSVWPLPQSEADWKKLRDNIYRAHPDHRSAEKVFDGLLQSLSAQPGQLGQHAYVILWRGEARENGGKFDQAAADVRQYCKLNPAARWSSPAVCRILTVSGHYKEAIVGLRQYILSEQRHAGPYALLSVASAFRQDDQAAASNLTLAMLKHFNKHEMKMTRGPFFGEATEAALRARCTSVLKREPNSWQCHFELAVMDALTQNYQSAIDELTACLKSNPSMAAALIARANCYLETNNMNAAKADVLRAIAIDAKEPAAYLTFQRYYELSGNKFEQYLAELDRILSKDPRNPVIWIAKAKAYEKELDTTRALDSYAHAIAVDQRCAGAFNSRGDLHQQLFKYEDAIKDFTSAIKIEPGNPHPYRDRATCYFAAHKDKEAISDITKVIELTQDPYAYAARAECYKRLGQDELAARDRQMTVQNIPHN